MHFYGALSAPPCSTRSRSSHQIAVACAVVELAWKCEGDDNDEDGCCMEITDDDYYYHYDLQPRIAATCANNVFTVFRLLLDPCCIR